MALALCGLVLASMPAAADTVDVSTVVCEKLASDYKPLDGSIGILAWTAGYDATEEQGTIVDWGKTIDAAKSIQAFCGENPKIGIMSASEKFMGENAADVGADAVDISTIKCEATEKLPNFSDTIMWIAGYHASNGDEETIVDWTKMSGQLNDILKYCAANPQVGLFTASEKFMGAGN